MGLGTSPARSICFFTRSGSATGNGREQSFCIWVPGRRENGSTVGHFNNSPQIHHSNPVTDMLNNTEIVSDEQVCQIELVLQILKKIENLSLNRYIKSRNRLIGNNYSRFENQSSGNGDTLSLPRRKNSWG